VRLTAQQTLSVLTLAHPGAPSLDVLARARCLVAVCLTASASASAGDEIDVDGVRVVGLDDVGERDTHRSVAHRWAMRLERAVDEVYCSTVMR
jgi:hypothetical protein